MSRLRRAFTSEKKPTVPETPYKPPLTAAQQANASYWDAVEEEHAIGLDSVTKGKGREIERLWGLENFGNTCYCNSVLQALYACEPFKHFIQSYPSIPPPVSPLGPNAGSELFKALPLEKQVSMTNFNNAFGNGPVSPVAVKGNPFDNPQLTSPSSKPTTPGGKEKRGWGGLGRKQSTSHAHGMSSSPSQLEIPSTPAVSAPSPSAAAKLDIPIIVPDQNQPPPTVFETIQTLFHHLTTSPPHQPISVKKPQDANSGAAQTASLLPVEGSNGAPTPSLSSSLNGTPPQGPPLLASLPPPSAPRAGGPYAAGSLGRGVVRPEDLLKTVKKENEMFRGMSQQDAHEFLGWLLNRVAEEVELLDKGLRANGKEITEAKGNGKTFVQNLFEGVLTNETRCLSCETTSSRDELFLDLSIDIEQHTSVTSCLRQFSASEMLCQKNKFFCDSCCGLQEAEKRMKIKRLPNVLALHLKRFKYQENLGRYTKLFYRVPFPTQLKLPNTSDDVENPDRLYELFAVVVHIGNGPHHGHYVAMVRSAGRWVMCDDENIEPIDEKDIFRYFGDYPSGAGYVLFYQAVDLDLRDLGMKNPPKPTSPAAPMSTTMPAAPGPVVTTAPIALAPVISNGVPNLKDVEEEHEETPLHSPTRQVFDTPTSPAVVNPASVSTPSAVSKPDVVTPTPAVNGSGSRSGSVDRSVDRQIGFTPSTPALASPKIEAPRSTPADGQKPKKIPPPPPRSRSASQNFLSSPASPKPPPPAPSAVAARSSPAPTPSPAAAPTPQATTPQAPASVSNTTSPTPPRVISNPANNPSPNVMSSSMMSNFSQSSSNSSAPPPSNASAGAPASYNTQSSLGRNPSTSGRDRNVSASSNASGNGGKLSRRLSGMSFKMGFGKKKDKENGIEEEDNKKSERKGLLG